VSTKIQRTCFVGYCWGAAGSAWLARVLNAHEDVLCLHSPIVPRFDHYKIEDSCAFLKTIFRGGAMGAVYPVAGVTHGVPIEWQGTLAEKLGIPLREFVLVRDPVPRVRSVARLRQQHWREKPNEPRWRKAYRETRERLERATGRRFAADPDASAFQYACHQLNSIVAERKTGVPIFRLEDLVAGEEGLQRLLAHASAGRCSFDAPRLARLQALRLNTHAERPQTSEEIWDGWSEEERAAFRTLLTPESRKAYEELGYAVP